MTTHFTDTVGPAPVEDLGALIAAAWTAATVGTYLDTVVIPQGTGSAVAYLVYL